MNKRFAIAGAVFMLVFALRMAAYSSPTVSVQLTWEHEHPTTIAYYNIYVSDTQGVFGSQPYARVSRLPDDAWGVPLELPVNVTKYLTVTAVDDAGMESVYGNELKIVTTIVVTDLQ